MQRRETIIRLRHAHVRLVFEKQVNQLRITGVNHNVQRRASHTANGQFVKRG